MSCRHAGFCSTVTSYFLVQVFTPKSDMNATRLSNISKALCSVILTQSDVQLLSHTSYFVSLMQDAQTLLLQLLAGERDVGGAGDGDVQLLDGGLQRVWD